MWILDSESAFSEKLNRNINSILLRVRVPKANTRIEENWKLEISKTGRNPKKNRSMKWKLRAKKNWFAIEYPQRILLIFIHLSFNCQLFLFISFYHVMYFLIFFSRTMRGNLQRRSTTAVFTRRKCECCPLVQWAWTGQQFGHVAHNQPADIARGLQNLQQALLRYITRGRRYCLWLFLRPYRLILALGYPRHWICR